jgi:pimeloyl-ACP methyl ester carboxylesterase
VTSAPILLLHGWCGDASFWPPLLEERRPLALELDHGGALPVPSEPSILVGHSMGATLARRIARHHPSLVRALVFLDGHLPKHPPDPARRGPFLQPFREDYHAAASAYIDSLTGPRTPAWVKERMLAKPPAQGFAALEALNDPDTCAWTGEADDALAFPVLALWALPSPLAKPGPAHEAWMRQWCPRLRYEVWPGASHFLHLEEPARLEALLREFLKENAL